MCYKGHFYLVFFKYAYFLVNIGQILSYPILTKCYIGHFYTNFDPRCHLFVNIGHFSRFPILAMCYIGHFYTNFDLRFHLFVKKGHFPAYNVYNTRFYYRYFILGSPSAGLMMLWYSSLRYHSQQVPLGIFYIYSYQNTLCHSHVLQPVSAIGYFVHLLIQKYPVSLTGIITGGGCASYLYYIIFCDAAHYQRKG